MQELKSIRIRKLTNGSNTGSLDLKVTLFGLTASNTQRKAKAIIPGTGQVYWNEIEFSGPKYDSKTNDEIIEEFISSNSSREKTRLGLPVSKTLYRILQNPWQENPPFLRNYGEDPYYLNNGAAIKIEWKKFMTASYSFSSQYLYANGTNSSPTAILVLGDVTLDGKKPSDLELDYPSQFRLFYNVGSFSLTSSVTDALFQSENHGFSNAFKDRNYLLDSGPIGYVSGIESTLESLSNNSAQQEDILADTPFVFPPIGPSPILSNVSGYEYSDINLKEINTPTDIFKQVKIIPKRISDNTDEGDQIEEKRTWGLNFDLKPDYTYNLEPQFGIAYSQDYQFKSDIKDEVIVQKTIETWIKELSLVYPTAKNYNLKLSQPDYKPPTERLIPDYSPINAWGMSGSFDTFPNGTQFKFEIVGTDSNYLAASASGQTPSASQGTASQIEKLKMQTQFPENWVVRADEPAATFSIWVGEIEVDIPPEGFIYSEEADDISLLSPEYLEDEFAGQPEESPEAINEEQEYDDYQFELEIAQLSSQLNSPQAQSSASNESNSNTGESGTETPQDNVGSSTVITLVDVKFDKIPGTVIDNAKNNISCVQVNGKPVNIAIAKALLNLIDYAKKQGISLNVNSGFRPAFGPHLNTKSEGGVKVTADSQEQLYNAFVARGKTGADTAKPGRSKHGYGLAIDFNTGTRNTKKNKNISFMDKDKEKKYAWLVKNGWKFGYIRTVGSEEWHFEYIYYIIFLEKFNIRYWRKPIIWGS
ncbi:hypothetical protein EBU95_13315 [bacterium]|nr:hypothetical protein [bacterium]